MKNIKTIISFLNGVVILGYVLSYCGDEPVNSLLGMILK
jgi:hypothetical protein